MSRARVALSQAGLSCALLGLHRSGASAGAFDVRRYTRGALWRDPCLEEGISVCEGACCVPVFESLTEWVFDGQHKSIVNGSLMDSLTVHIGFGIDPNKDLLQSHVPYRISNRNKMDFYSR